MTKPKVDLEAYAQNKKAVKIPDVLMDVYIMHEMKWTIQELRTQPQHVIERLQLLWHLQNIADEAAWKTNGK